MPTTNATHRLSEVVRTIVATRRTELEHMKASASDLDRPDFVWHYLLQSFATMGRTAGWQGLIGNSENYDQVTYSALEKLSAEQRSVRVHDVCRAARIRMPDRKAKFILGCFERIASLGGPLKTKEILLALPGREEKIRFLQSFPGIGPKYARNIMMDVYHEEFRESIAIDARIESVTTKLGLSFRSYADHEAFYLNVAKSAGLNGWELDRLLYNYLREVQQQLEPMPAEG